jgi:hypothetical protein
MKAVLAAAALSLCWGVRCDTVPNGPDAGLVHFVRSSNDSLNPYLAAPNPETQSWLRGEFWRMLVYSPYFDEKLSWYPNGWVYLDAYAIYTDSSLANQHPEWILKDASGNRLYIPWGCSAGTCPQYAGNFSNASFRQWWIGQAQQILSHGYKGLFIDDVDMDFRVGNGAGNFVDPIDPNTGTAMTESNWRSYMAAFMGQVRSAFPSVEIVHNSIWYAGPSSVRDLDPSIQQQIGAANYLNIEFGVNDSGLTGGNGEWSLNAVLGYIDRLHAAGKGAIIDGVPMNSAGQSYALANYFMISNGSDALGNSTATPANWWIGFETNLGAPLAARTTWNGLLRRNFSNGIALVNPPQSPTITVALPGSFRAAGGGPAVTSVTLAPSQGTVLLQIK